MALVHKDQTENQSGNHSMVHMVNVHLSRYGKLFFGAKGKATHVTVPKKTGSMCHPMGVQYSLPSSILVRDVRCCQLNLSSDTGNHLLATRIRLFLKIWCPKLHLLEWKQRLKHAVCLNYLFHFETYSWLQGSPRSSGPASAHRMLLASPSSW